MGVWNWAAFVFVAGLLWAGGDPRYTLAGELIRPVNYREWVWLSSGLGMTYGPAARAADSMPPLFDNVFVNPQAYRNFVGTGRWPDKTIFILEIRYSQSHGSINRGGSFQTDIAALEAAVKDEGRFPDKWAYFDFETAGGAPSASARPLPKTAGCYGCHSANGAVENTFVQFYPTLLEIAQKKGVLKPSFHAWTPSPAGVYHTITSTGWMRAKSELERARADEPDAPALRAAALNQVARQLLHAGRATEAVSVLEYAITLHPKSPALHTMLSEAYEVNGRSADALASSRKALELLKIAGSTPSAGGQKIEQELLERIKRLERRQ
jgi:hypothetical protein